MKVQLSHAMTREFNQGIDLCKPLRGIKFTYSNSKCQKVLEKELKALEEAEKPSEDYNKYMEKLRSIHQENVLKGKDGNEETIIDEHSSRVSKYKDQAKVEGKLKELRSKYAKTIAEHRKKIEDFQRFLLEKVELDIQEYKGELPSGSIVTQSEDPQTGSVTDKSDSRGNNIKLYQVDGIIWLLVTPDAIPKQIEPDKKDKDDEVKWPAGVKLIEFTRQAILDYRQLFGSLFSVDNPEFIEIFKKNIYILKTMQQELIDNPIIRDYYDIYEAARQKLIREHAVENIFGDPTTALMGRDRLRYVMKDEEKFNKAADALQEKYKTIIDTHKAFVDETIQVAVYEISEDLLWEDIDGSQMEALIDFIS